MLMAVECWNLVADPNAVSARRSLEQRALIAVQGLLRSTTKVGRKGEELCVHTPY